MGFFDWLKKQYRRVENRMRQNDRDFSGTDMLAVMYSGGTVRYEDVVARNKADRERREKEVKNKTKTNTVSPLFNIKNFLLGAFIFKEKIGLAKLLSDQEKSFIKNKENSDLEVNIYTKLKMLNVLADDIFNTTQLTDEDKEYIRNTYKGSEFNIISKDQFKKERFKDKKVDNSTLDKLYNEYVEMQRFKEKTYGNQHIEYTSDYNKYAQKIKQDTQDYMTAMLSGLIPRDSKSLSQLEQSLNDTYVQLIEMGYNEAKMYQYPLLQDEAVAHHRILSIKEQEASKSILDKNWAKNEQVSNVEFNAFYNPDNKESLYSYVLRSMQDFLKEDKEAYKAKQDYNADLEISDMLNIASGDLFDGSETDDNGSSLYKFRSLEDGTEDLMGLKGFNDWRKQGYLDNILNNRELLEDLAVTYKVIASKQGEEAANNWLQQRFQHYASEGISGWDQTWNSVAGFCKDVVGDAAEIVGGAWGVASGVGTGLWNSAFSGDSLELVWTDAVGQAFDNNLTRWGTNLSTTGYFDADKQQQAKEIGFSTDDNIIDPEHTDDFLFKGGGSGWGYFLGETGRQSSHTMFAVWSGGILGKGLGKGGALIGKMLKGTKAAMTTGYRIGSNIGLMISASNEGIMDGIQVRDDVYNQGILQVEQEMADRAITQAITLNTNSDDDLAIAQFLLNNHVGDYQYQDEKGNIVTGNDLVYRDSDGKLKTSMNRRLLVELLRNSEYGNQIIENYKAREDIAAEYEEMKRQVNNSAIRNGAATAVIENYINGSIRSHNAGVRANIKGAEREFKKRLAATTINRQGEVSIKKAGVGFALRQSGLNALHEAMEEGLQSITLTTFTAVGNNSIKRYIDNTYDTDTWKGFLEEYSSVVGDVVQNAGAGFLNLETYEAAILGAIGSLMGFGTLKRKSGSSKWYNVRGTWQGSVFNVKGTMRAENDARRDMAQALQNAIQKDGGVTTLMSMTSTSQAINRYNNAIENDPLNLNANNELAVDAMMHNVSTLVFARNTEFGKMIYANLDYQSLMLGEDFENSEMSQNEVNQRRLEKAREFLTTEVEGEELTAKKNAALKEVQEWIKSTGGNVRSIEEIAANPTEAEAQALVDIVMTARLTNELVEKMTDIDAENSRNVQGLNFVAKNELNVKTLLLQNQEERMKASNDRLTRIAEQGSPRSNSTLSVEQKQSIAVLGNSNEQRETNRKQYESDRTEALNNLKKIQKELKAVRKQVRAAIVQKNGLLISQYKREEQALEDQENVAKHAIKIADEYLTKDKKSMWDRLTGVEEADELAEQARVLTAYDILTLTPHERAMMLDPKNKDRYSPELLEQIREARHLLVYGNATDLIQQTNYLQTEISANSEEIDNVLTSIDGYNKHVLDAEEKFRINVLNYRYLQDIHKEMDIDEVNDFIKRLDGDVELGLISTTERNQMVNLAIANEKDRISKDPNNPDIKRGWQLYNDIKKQAREIGSTLKNNNVVVDEAKFDNFMVFLSEVNMTLLDFNNLNLQEKQRLLSDSKVLDIRDNTNEINSFIEFSADILHTYDEVKLKRDKINQDLARGRNDGSTAEESIVQVEEEQDEEVPVERSPENRELLLRRTSIDNVRTFGSHINRILDYLKNNDILNDETYRNTAPKLLDAVMNVAMSDERITSMKQLYLMIDNEIEDPDVRNTWYEVLGVMRIKYQTKRAASNTFRDRTLASSGAASSSTIETQKVSQLRTDDTKRPIVGFLELHRYEEASKAASQLSLGSTGLGRMIFYVTDPRTTAVYRELLGQDYSDANNLPIFTCVEVSENFENAIPIKVGDTTIYVAPIGVLKENTLENENARGILWTLAIRNVASLLVNNTNQPMAVTANGMPITSSPQNWANYMRQLGAAEHTGRRSILEEVKGFGDQVKSSINSIISKLKVRDVGTKKNQRVYDNGLPDNRVPIIKQAGLNELTDASKEAPITEVLGGLNVDLGWSINNPIILMFYNNILTAKGNLAELILSRTHLVKLLDNRKIGELNDQINKLLSKSFWIGSYNGEKQWKYEIDTKLLINGNFILRAVPEGLIQEESGESTVNEEVQDSKQVVLLNFTNLFDEAGNINLSVEHANTILLNLLFNSSEKERTRDGYGTSFALVQLSHGLINHANGIFTEEEDKKLSAEERQEKQKLAHSVLSTLIEGGGLLVEGSVDTSNDALVLQRPVVFDKDRNVVSGQVHTAALVAALTKIKGLQAPGLLDTTTDTQKEENISRSRYVLIIKDRANGAMLSTTLKFNMWATSLSKWLTGMFWEKKSSESGNNNSNTNKEITFNTGTNTDLIFRHILWTSDYNDNVSEKEGLKRIPLDDSDTGEGFYTDKELENQFGFHASHVKALAYAFNSYLTQLNREKGYTFVTNVIKPKATIEVTDKETGKKYRVPMAGELDMLAVDLRGQLHPIDFKTVRFQENSKQEFVRSDNVLERMDAIKNLMGHSYEEYEKQLNLYLAALKQKGFDVGEALILAVPVAYPNDPTVKSIVREDSEYGNNVSIREDGSPFLEGLGLFEAVDNGNGIITPPVKLTHLHVPYNDNFEFSMQDIIYMALSDVDFLRNNPEFTEAIDNLRAENANTSTIEVKLVKEETPRERENISEMVNGKLTFRRRSKKHAVEQASLSEEQRAEVKDLAIGKTRANFAEVNRRIEQLENESTFDEEIDKIEFIVDGESRMYTVKQVKELMADLLRQSEETSFTSEDMFNNMTVQEVCDELNCRG